jgi:CheY-like chemotaxis protein
MEASMHGHFRGGRTDKVNPSQPCTETIPESDSIVGNTDLIRGRGTILRVEDESFLRKVACEILESAGYRVLKAAPLRKRYLHSTNTKPIVRLLLTDVVLPGQNGRDLATDLRYVCPKLRIIFFSGYPENVGTRQGLQEDGMFYLPKPFSAQSLTRKLPQVPEQPDTTNTNVQAASYDSAEDWA